MNQQKRRFSIDEDFMKARIDAHLYGFMRCLSTARPATREELNEKPKCEQTEYLLASTLNKSKKIIMDVCGIGTTKTFRRHILDLIEAGLIEEGKIKVKNEKGKEYEYDCYFFPFDYDGNYKLIDKEFLRYLVDTGNAMSIKVYLYLLNCSTAKDNWVFTINEISVALGYARSTQTAESVIKDCLECFKRQGIVEYVDTYEQVMDAATGESKPVPKKVLKFVAVSKEQLPSLK